MTNGPAFDEFAAMAALSSAKVIAGDYEATLSQPSIDFVSFRINADEKWPAICRIAFRFEPEGATELPVEKFWR